MERVVRETERVAVGRITLLSPDGNVSDVLRDESDRRGREANVNVTIWHS